MPNERPLVVLGWGSNDNRINILSYFTLFKKSHYLQTHIKTYLSTFRHTLLWSLGKQLAYDSVRDLNGTTDQTTTGSALPYFPLPPFPLFYFLFSFISILRSGNQYLGSPPVYRNKQNFRSTMESST